MRIAISIFLICLAGYIQAQSNRHWTRNFNEESSLLSGAVVGGKVGPSAIYYNPAAISDVVNSSLSINASLFTLDFINMKNALGDGVSLKSSRLQIQPRFISYLIHPRNEKRLSIEIAYLNNEYFEMEFSESKDETLDILTGLEGDERYFSSFRYSDRYRDDWIGIGLSYVVNKQLLLGLSMFTQAKSNQYNYLLDIEAFPLKDTVMSTGGDSIPFYSASYQEQINYKYNNYRLVWKLGFLYKEERWSLGVTFKTPSVNVFSDGKRIKHKNKRTNITDPATGDFLPNYVFVDEKQKKDVEANWKDPFSIAAGFTLTSIDRAKIFFATVEYFNGIEPYPALKAETDYQFDSQHYPLDELIERWLYVGSGATPVFNAAIGYSWQVKEELQILSGFRTDFNYLKGVKDEIRENYQAAKRPMLDVYHITGGVKATVLKQNLIAGIQYSFGWNTKQTQIANISEPVEYDDMTGLALQGIPKNNMSTFYNSLSIYFGATFNFGFVEEK
jgi:hypothetical protein